MLYTVISAEATDPEEAEEKLMQRVNDDLYTNNDREWRPVGSVALHTFPTSMDRIMYVMAQAFFTED
jgi:hypothetical protein